MLTLHLPLSLDLYRHRFHGQSTKTLMLIMAYTIMVLTSAAISSLDLRRRLQQLRPHHCQHMNQSQQLASHQHAYRQYTIISGRK